MNPKLLDQLDGMGGELDGFMDVLGSIGGALKTVATKALPIISTVFTGQPASTIVGAAAAYAQTAAQKKLIDAQAKLAQAQTDAQQIAAQANLQKRQIEAAAAQTVINGINKGMIEPDATYAQAGRVIVQEVVRSAGVNPDSAQGSEAVRIITQAAQPDNTLLYVGGAVAVGGLVYLLARRK